MGLNLTEEEMRKALFGSTDTRSKKMCSADLPPTPSALDTQSTPATLKARIKPKNLAPKLSVTLKVTKTFEGPVEVFVHEADTLSTLVAEQEAKKAAKKKRFQYFDVVSIEPTA